MAEENKKFAVIKLGGSQLRVKEGLQYDVKKLKGNKGDVLEISDVLLVADGNDTKVGTPYVNDAKVTLEIASQTKGEKIDVFKYNAKSRYRRRSGHRSEITKVLVKKIS